LDIAWRRKSGDGLSSVGQHALTGIPPNHDRQLTKWEIVPAAGVHHGCDHRMPRVPARDATFELGLPAIECQPTRGRIGRPIGAVDDLIRAAHESIQSMDGRAHVSGEAQSGAVVGGNMSALHSPTCTVGRKQFSVGA
jgi:hypothetical protein